ATHASRIGGLQYETYDGCEEEVKAFCRDFEKKVVEYEELLTESRIWVQRTRNVGILTPQDAIDMGATGPVLRGSGIRWDIRKAFPYAAYDQFQFDIPIGERGDTYDRYLVRMEEMRQSRRIILQAVRSIPEGPIRARVGRVIKPPPGEVYHSIEAPKGELGYYIVSDGTTQPYRLRIRPPSFINLEAFDKMVRGHLVADVVAMIGTLGLIVAYLVYAERKILAHLQVRLGPMRVGPHGLLQPIADGLKLLLKEDIIPAGADKWVFWLAPAISVLAAFTAFSLIPFAPNFYITDVNVGLLFLIGISSLGIFGIILGGWASNSHYPLLGALGPAAELGGSHVALGFSLVSALRL